MCRGCGEEYFETHERPELTPEMALLAEQIAQEDQEYKLSYGRLHIVIDDWNLEAEHIEWCLSPDNSHERPLTELERTIGATLLEMTEPERYAVMDRAEERGQELYRKRTMGA